MTEGERNSEAHVNGRRKTRPANGRSKSEPPKELQLYNPSPESDHLPPPTCNGSAKPSIDEIDMYECKI